MKTLTQNPETINAAKIIYFKNCCVIECLCKNSVVLKYISPLLYTGKCNSCFASIEFFNGKFIINKSLFNDRNT